MTRTTALRRGLVAALAAVAAAAGPLPQLAHADATPAAPAEVTIPGTAPVLGPVGTPVQGASADGYLAYHRMVAATYQEFWHPSDGSPVRDLGAWVGRARASAGHGTTVIWGLRAGGTTLSVYETKPGTWKDYALPGGLHASDIVDIVPTSTGWNMAVLVRTTDASGTVTGGTLHLYAPTTGGMFTDRPVQGWQIADAWSSVQARSIEGILALAYQVNSANWTALIDTDTAQVTYSAAKGSGDLLLNHREFGWGTAQRTAVLRPLDDPQSAGRVLKLPDDPTTSRIAMVLTDTALLSSVIRSPMEWGTGGPLYEVPLDGSPASVLMQGAGNVRPTLDGGALVDHQSGDDTWATDTVPATGGAPAELQPFTAYRTEHVGLSMARGRVDRVEAYADKSDDSTVSGRMSTADVGTGAAPEQVPTGSLGYPFPDDEIPRCGQAPCMELLDGGGSAGASYARIDSAQATQLESTKTNGLAQVGPSGGRFVSAAGNAVLYDNTANGTQYLVDAGTGTILRKRPIVAAALWGATLWTATSTAGRFTAENAATGTGATTVTTDAPCVPDDAQVLGRWLYWSCGANGPAGVWDSTSGRSVRVPAGHALLGDGFVLRHTGGQLLLTDVHAGTATADRVVADLPAQSVADDRNMSWTVDKYRGFLAYTDADGTTHVVPTGVPQSPIGVAASTGTSSANVAASGWKPVWTPTGPVASWRLDLRRKGSTAIVRTLSGTDARDTVSPVWDGKDASGLPVSDGDFTWTLTLTPANGQGGPGTVTGPLSVSGHPAPAHDYSGDRAGDLLALTSGGRLDLRPGTGTTPGGVRSTSSSGSGWPSTSLLVPTGDLTADGANDLLVRDSAGRLTRYDATPGRAFTPSGPHRLIGGGWQIYDSLTVPGDLTGDGRADLLARDRNGDLYLYAATSGGVFAARKLVGWGYDGYDMLFGGHDLPGVNDGSLFARDKSGVLWRYDADSKGGLKARVRVGGGWQVYNSLVGVGDLNGDGRSDLIARDRNGDLWRYDGLYYRRFAARVKIGWGWQAYKALL